MSSTSPGDQPFLTPPVASAYTRGPYGLKIAKRPIPGVKHIVVVASGKGGVGKSTVATNLALGLSEQGFKAGLLDADIYGPSAPTMLGVHQIMQVDQNDKLIPAENNGLIFASFGLLMGGKEAAIWRGPMLSKAVLQLCYEVCWGELDFLIVDLPPGTGDVQLTLLERLPISGAIIVSTPQDVALIDAEKALSMFRRLATPVLGMVANMLGHQCSNCGHNEAIFGEQGAANFAIRRDLPLLMSIPLKGAIRQAADSGQPLWLHDQESAQLFNHLAQKISAFFHQSSDKNA